MNLRAIRSRSLSLCGLGCLVCLFALPVLAGPNTGKISGVVVDPAGTPQMGATVLVTSERSLVSSPIQMLTNDRGRFSTAVLPSGAYSVKVTLAGFLPAMEQNILVDDQHATLLQIVLGSVFSSFEKLRRQPDQPVASDDWAWVLRTAPDTRSVLRWQADPSNSSTNISVNNPAYSSDSRDQGDPSAQSHSPHGRVELTSGAAHPGSVGNLADSPGTAFVYDVSAGAKGRLLMAGQFSYEATSAAEGLAAEWLPSGSAESGPVTTVVVREARLGPQGPEFRGLLMSHDEQLALSDRLTIRYGAEYMMASLHGTTTSLRPRVEALVQLGQTWRAMAVVTMAPPQDSTPNENQLQSAINSFDAFPTLMMRRGRPVFEDGIHEEIGVEHTLGAKSDVSAAVFHDRSSHTAVIGHGGPIAPDFLQDYYSSAFAYDGGSSTSTGARVVYRRKFNENLTSTVIYAYAGALAPDAQTSSSSTMKLRDQLSTHYRQSLAGSFSATAPRFGTKVTASYKWLSGTTVSQQDAYGESLYHVDPYLNMEIRQPLPSVFPCHMEVQANVGNLLGQGYVSVLSKNGYSVLVPSYRYFRGGLSLQF